MSINKFDELFNNTDQRSGIAERRSARRKAMKVEDDPFAFDKPGKKKKVLPVVQEPVLELSSMSVSDEGKVPNIENVVYYENGKELKPEDAFKGAGYALFVASLFRMYHDNVGYRDADLNAFNTIIMEAIRLYGPDIKISDSVVGACSFHMEINQVVPYHALRDARVSIKENVPRTVYADMVVSGDTGMIVDTVTGTVVIKDDPGLSKRATKSMGPLFQAKISPKEEIVSVVSDLTNTRIEFVDDLEDEVVRWLDEDDVPEISETQPFRSLTNVPGLISAAPVVLGNQGYYQNIYKFLKSVEKVKPDVMFVPDNNQAMTGTYTSLDDCSRCIPLPDDLRQASPLLASVNVATYDDVITGLRQAEITVANDEKLKRDGNINARSYYHSQFSDEYAKYRNTSHGKTLMGLNYVTLWHYKPISAQELYNDFINGLLDDFPVFMRASEYYLATLKGVKGSFVITDLAAMVGVYMTTGYVREHIQSKFCEGDKMGPVTGFYVLKDYKTGSVNVYSTWIQKYLLSKMVDVLYPGKDLGKNILAQYISYASTGKGVVKSKDLIKTTLQNLIKCYDKVKVDPARILSLTPNYSMKKGLKYTKLMLDTPLLDRMAADVQGKGQPPNDPGENSDGDSENSADDDYTGDDTPPKGIGINLDDAYAYVDSDPLADDSDGDQTGPHDTDE